MLLSNNIINAACVVLICCVVFGVVYLKTSEADKPWKSTDSTDTTSWDTFHGKTRWQWEEQLLGENVSQQLESVRAFAELGDLSESQVAAIIRFARMPSDVQPEALALIGRHRLVPEQSIDLICELLADSSTTEPSREAAVEAAGEMGALFIEKSGFLMPLLNDPSLQIMVLKSLGKIKSPKSVSGVAGLLADDQESTRRAALSCLAEMGDVAEPAIVSVIKVLETGTLRDDQEISPAECLVAFGEAGIPRILESLESTDHDYYRVQALRALGQITSELGLGNLSQETINSVSAHLIRGANHENESVRVAAYEASTRMGPVARQLEDVLIERITIERPELRPRIIECLIAVDADPEVIVNTTLAAIYDGANREVTYRRLIKRVGYEAVPHLRKAKSDRDPAVRQFAIDALRHLEGVYSWDSIEQLTQARAE